MDDIEFGVENITKQNGLTHKTDPIASLKGHQKGICQMKWHHFVPNLMTTTGVDKTLRVWDVENQATSFIYDGITEEPTCVNWSPNGNLLALNQKKGLLSVLDMRTNDGKGGL